MKIKINYPSEQSGVELLNKGIEEFKATLYIESIARLNASEETKKNKMEDTPMKKLFWKMGLPMII